MINAMSVDVEDYFQVSAFESAIPRNQWEKIPCRVEHNVARILELFDRYKVKATFFTLGWMAERYPAMIQDIIAQGHEIASHGWEHIRVVNQSPDQFRSDVLRTKYLLEDLTSLPVKGYRAASYSINRSNLWALNILDEAGYEYSSSVVPIEHDLYGMPGASRFPFRPGDTDFLEIPISTVNLAGKQLNCGGGGWFRLFPYRFSRWAMKSINEVDQLPCVFYFHPWEIDEQQPKVDGISLKTRFRHYYNLGRTYNRLESLLRDFQWSTMDDVFLQDANQCFQPKGRLSCL